jgi:O-antigen ligase
MSMPQMFALWAFFLMPLSFVANLRASAILYIVLGLLGLHFLIKRRNLVLPAWRASAATLLPFVVLLPYELASVAFQHSPFKTTDNGIHFLLFVLISAAVPYLTRRDMFWIGISAASLGIGGVALFQHWVLGVDRVYGTFGHNPVLHTSGAIKFGMVATLFASLSLVALANAPLLHAGRTLNGWRVWHTLGALGGVTAALLTASRGPILALLPAIVAVLAASRRNPGRTRAQWAWSAFAVVLILALAGALLAHLMGGRVDEGLHEYQQYDAGDVDTSVGARLAMWTAAWHMFLAHPWFGVGLNQFGVALREMIAQGQVNPALGMFDHPHNEYFEALSCGGVVGVLFLGWLFLSPLILFARRIWTPRPGTDHTAALAGFVTVVCYMVFALTDCFLDRQITTSVYAFLILSCAVMSAPALATRAVESATSMPSLSRGDIRGDARGEA